MNKKIFIRSSIAIVVLLAAAGAYWLFRPGMPIEKVLPQGPMGYVRLAHGAKLWTSFMESPFYKSLSVIDIDKVLRQNNFSAQDIAHMSTLQEQWAQVNSNPWIKKVFGKEVVIAFYADAKQEIYPIIAIRLDKTLQTAQTLAQLFKPSKEEVKISSKVLNGQTVYAVTMIEAEQTIYYIHKRDLIIIAQKDIAQLVPVIDVLKGKGKALEQDASWKFTKAQGYVDADADAFVNPYPLVMALNAEAQGQDNQADVIDNLKDVKTVSFSFNYNDASRFKFSVDVDQKALVSKEGEAVISCAQTANDSMTMIPVNVIAYNWSNCYDFSKFFAQVQSQLNDYPAFQEAFTKYTKAINRYLGLDIQQDLLPLFGHEVGGYITDIDTKAMFPYPRFLTFVKLTDIAKAKPIFKSMEEKLPVDVLKETYQGVEISYLTFPLGSNTDPSYAIVGDYVLMASSRQLLKKSIEAVQAPAHALSEDKIIKELGLSASDQFNGVMLLRPAAVVKRAKSLLGWMDKFLTSQINAALSYKKDWESRKDDFDSQIKEKDDELAAAQERLTQINAQAVEGNQEQLKYITEDIGRIKADIDDIKLSKEKVAKSVEEYQVNAKAARLMMFNAEHVFVPVLNAFETIDAQAITTQFKDNLIQTEVVFK